MFYYSYGRSKKWYYKHRKPFLYCKDKEKMNVFRGRAAGLVLAFALATVSLSLAASALFSGDDPFSAGESSDLNQRESDGWEAVVFTCNAGTEYEFTFAVEVDLSDGMSSAEATLAATSLFKHEIKHSSYTVKSTQSNGDGTWTVYLNWDGSHYFNVHVNPSNRTVEYERCY
jgi:hypothetical protein